MRGDAARHRRQRHTLASRGFMIALPPATSPSTGSMPLVSYDLVGFAVPLTIASM
jgi:hypothetical protein